MKSFLKAVGRSRGRRSSSCRPCWCTGWVCAALGADKAFPGWSQAFALIPGLSGDLSAAGILPPGAAAVRAGLLPLLRHGLLAPDGRDRPERLRRRLRLPGRRHARGRRAARLACLGHQRRRPARDRPARYPRSGSSQGPFRGSQSAAIPGSATDRSSWPMSAATASSVPARW